MKIVYYKDLDEEFFKYKEIEQIASVKTIIKDVQKHGDSAVKKYTVQFDGVELEQFKVSPNEIKKAYDQIDKSSNEAINAAAKNIERFAQQQKEQFQDFEFEIQSGVFTGQKIIPIERVGVYTPGGNFPLPSTVLMCTIPAKIAGVKQIIVCSPPAKNGSIHPAIIIAAVICDVDAIYKIGGVQAIAAMAYGTESICSVDKIVGPGNKFVTAAKKLVYGTVGIDFIAGPTELLVFADETANPAFIAADLLGQAEHDINAIPLLVTNSSQLAERVNKEINQQLETLSTAAIAEQSIHKNGTIIIVDQLAEAVEISNRKAPEHLELHIENPDEYIDKLRNYGSLFIGSYAAEVLGDYSSGLNHTLPTNTTARYTGGLSVKDFLKLQTTLRVEKSGLSTIGPIAKKFGEMEGLEGHAKSMGVRLDS